MTATWLLATVMGDSKTNNAKKCRKITGNFGCHADAAVRYGAHCLMNHIQGFTKSHSMPPLGECLHHIAQAAAKVNNFK
jgi:hypothetical protein